MAQHNKSADEARGRSYVAARGRSRGLAPRQLTDTQLNVEQPRLTVEPQQFENASGGPETIRNELEHCVVATTMSNPPVGCNTGNVLYAPRGRARGRARLPTPRENIPGHPKSEGELQ